MRKGLIRLFLLVISLLSLTLLTSCGGGGGGGKGPSGPPNNTPPVSDQPSEPQVPSEWVQGVKATVMEHPGMIKLTRTPRTEKNVTYKVYRYDSKAADANVVDFPNIQENEYNDTTSVVDTPYYYRVTWIKDGNEYGKNAPLVVGLCREDTDPFEPNDYLNQAKELTPEMPVDDIYTFIFDDGVEGSTVDTDWYCCENTSEDTGMEITINLIGSTDLTIKCFHDEIEEILNDGIITLNIMSNDTKYFCIEPTDGEGFGKYQITFTDYID